MERDAGLKIPRGVVLLAMLVTAGATAWVLLGKKLDLSWPAETPPAVTAARPTIVASTAPAIQAGRSSAHGELGPCTLCHAVMATNNHAVPTITAGARPPHTYGGGVCINCHRVATGLANSVAPLAASSPPAAPATVRQQPSRVQPSRALPTLALPSAAAPPAPTSLAVEWLGARLTAIEPVAARQLGLPPNLKGVLVADVSGPASAVGLAAGDVLVAVNRVVVPDLSALSEVTRDGRLEGGVVQVLRHGTLFQAVLSRAAEPAPARQPASAPAVPHSHEHRDSDGPADTRSGGQR